MQNRWGECDVTEVPTVLARPPGDPARTKIEQAQPGARFAHADDDGIVAILGAARVLLGGFILGEQGDQVGVGERQMVGDASAPARQRGHRAIGKG